MTDAPSKEKMLINVTEIKDNRKDKTIIGSQ